MATTVAQHSVATFTSPVNGTTPIDANTVRGNDNTTRAAYNDHDADPGIHVQSSTLASRPVAGTAGRKWITEDSGVYTLWFDDGTNWHPVSSENVALTVLAGENLVKGDVVKVTGWNNGQDLPEVVKTTSAADTAFAVITATVSSGSMGYATNTGIVQDVNTAAYSVGTILYANGSGGFTSTKPTSGHYQPVAYVLRANASNGVYYVEFSTPRIVERSDNTASTIVLRDSNGDFSAGTITATAVNATTLDLTNLEVTNIKAKDGTQAIAIADTTGKLTISDGVLLSGLTASQAVFTDGSKNLVSNAITGTGNVVMSASPTLTGTVTAATLNATTLGGTLSTAAQPNVTSVGTLSSLTVSGNVTVDTNTLFVDAANDRVGIQTATPAYPLQVRRAGGAGSLGVSIDNAVSQRTVQYFAIGDTTTDTTAHGWYTRAGTATDVLRMSVDYLGNLAVDTNTLYVDAANNRVGVGTASPSQPLHVVGNTILGSEVFRDSTSSFIRLDGGSGSGSGANVILFGESHATAPGRISINAVSTGRIEFSAGGAERARIDASGNLGIGVTPSAWGSSNYRVLETAGGFFGNYTTGVVLMGQNYYDSSVGSFLYKNTGFASYYSQANGQHRFYTAPSGTAGNAITFTQAMTLDASGYLLLNGTQQYTRVTVKGSAGVPNGYGILGATATTGCYFGAISATANDDFEIWNERTGYLRFATANTERARIDANGNLGLGVTPDLWGSTYSAFQFGTTGSLYSAKSGADFVSLDYNVIVTAANDTYRQTDVATRYRQNSGQHRWFTATSGTAGAAITFTERLRVDATTTAGQTALLLWDVDNGTLERVTVGAADSGGTGFKVLRIPN